MAPALEDEVPAAAEVLRGWCSRLYSRRTLRTRSPTSTPRLVAKPDAGGGHVAQLAVVEAQVGPSGLPGVALR